MTDKTNGDEHAGENADELLIASEVRKLLGIGRTHLARLIRDGTLPTRSDPFDTRVKLIRRGDLDSLLKQSRKNAA